MAMATTVASPNCHRQRLACVVAGSNPQRGRVEKLVLSVFILKKRSATRQDDSLVFCKSLAPRAGIFGNFNGNFPPRCGQKFHFVEKNFNRPKNCKASPG